MAEILREGLNLNKLAVEGVSREVLNMFRQAFPYINHSKWEIFTNGVLTTIDREHDTPFAPISIRGVTLRSYEFNLGFSPSRYSQQPDIYGDLEVWSCIPPKFSFVVNPWVNDPSYAILMTVATEIAQRAQEDYEVGMELQPVRCVFGSPKFGRIETYKVPLLGKEN